MSELIKVIVSIKDPFTLLLDILRRHSPVGVPDKEGS